MATIHFPPSGSTGDTSTAICFSYREPLNIAISDSGFLSHDNPGAFQPDLPTGNFVAPPAFQIGSYYAAAQDSTITITYFYPETGKSDKYKITIRATCP